MRVRLIATTKVVDTTPNYLPHMIDIPTDADDLAEMAGRLCYLSEGRPNPATRSNADYLKNILREMHYSVMEHASATFYFDQVSRAFLAELSRHRHMSYSVVSQRYVDAVRFTMTEHPELVKLSAATKSRITELNSESRELYEAIVDELQELGDGRKTARGAARMVLLEATETRILISGNMRAWRELLWKRSSPAADAEIREVAGLVLPHLKKIAPNTFQDFAE